MTSSHKKYSDPSSVLHSLVDDYGNPISIGDQKDLGEFNMNILQRLEEGLSLHSEEEKGIIQKLFFGKYRNIVQSKEEDLTEIQEENNVNFSSIILDVM